eukprot:scaffold148_cov341-Pavlova_lutheri.AAC.28
MGHAKGHRPGTRVADYFWALNDHAHQVHLTLPFLVNGCTTQLDPNIGNPACSSPWKETK